MINNKDAYRPLYNCTSHKKKTLGHYYQGEKSGQGYH